MLHRDANSEEYLTSLCSTIDWSLASISGTTQQEIAHKDVAQLQECNDDKGGGSREDDKGGGTRERKDQKKEGGGEEGAGQCLQQKEEGESAEQVPQEEGVELASGEVRENSVVVVVARVSQWTSGWGVEERAVAASSEDNGGGGGRGDDVSVENVGMLCVSAGCNDACQDRQEGGGAQGATVSTNSSVVISVVSGGRENEMGEKVGADNASRECVCQNSVVSQVHGASQHGHGEEEDKEKETDEIGDDVTDDVIDDVIDDVTDDVKGGDKSAGDFLSQNVDVVHSKSQKRKWGAGAVAVSTSKVEEGQ